MRIDPWRALGAALCLVVAAVTCAVVIGAAWALGPYVVETLR